MPQLVHAITTTPYFDALIRRNMEQWGLNRSEVYRHLLLRAEGRDPTRVQIGQLSTAIKNEALGIQREGGDRHAMRVQAIIRAAGEILAIA